MSALKAMLSVDDVGQRTGGTFFDGGDDICHRCCIRFVPGGVVGPEHRLQFAALASANAQITVVDDRDRVALIVFICILVYVIKFLKK